MFIIMKDIIGNMIMSIIVIIGMLNISFFVINEFVRILIINIVGMIIVMNM